MYAFGCVWILRLRKGNKSLLGKFDAVCSLSLNINIQIIFSFLYPVFESNIWFLVLIDILDSFNMIWVKSFRIFSF